VISNVKQPYIIDIFDETETDTEVTTDTLETTPSVVLPKPIARSVSRDVETELRLSRVQEDLAKSNAEAAQRRRENKELKASVEQQQSELNAFKSRTVRTEARAALAERGVVHRDVLDIFLKQAGEKVVVDKNFDVLGIDEALDAFTQSHAVFFAKKADKQEAKTDDAAETEETEKSNKTSNGASSRGGGDDKSTTKADPNDNRNSSDTLKDYMKSMRRK
jgi:hypothetical protein